MTFIDWFTEAERSGAVITPQAAWDAAVREQDENINVAASALAGLLMKIEDRSLVRDTINDHRSDWVINAADLVLKIKNAQEALAKIRGDG